MAPICKGRQEVLYSYHWGAFPLWLWSARYRDLQGKTQDGPGPWMPVAPSSLLPGAAGSRWGPSLLPTLGIPQHHCCRSSSWNSSVPRRKKTPVSGNRSPRSCARERRQVPQFLVVSQTILVLIFCPLVSQSTVLWRKMVSDAASALS